MIEFRAKTAAVGAVLLVALLGLMLAMALNRSSDASLEPRGPQAEAAAERPHPEEDRAPGVAAAMRDEATPQSSASSFVVRTEFEDHQLAELGKVVVSLPGVADPVRTERLAVDRFRVWLPVAWQRATGTAEGPEFAETSFLTFREDVERTGELLLVVARTASALLLVQAHSGHAPVPAVTLSLSPVASVQGRQVTGRIVPFVGVTDADGRWALPKVPVGPYRVTTAGRYRVVSPSVILISPATPRHQILVATSESWDVRGRVIAEGDGAAIAHVAISLDGMKVVATSGDDGRFVLPGSLRVGSGASYLLDAVPALASGPYSARIRAGPYCWDDRDIEITLLPQSHVLEVQGAGAPVVVTGVSYRLGPSGFAGSKPGWHALDAVAPRRYLVPLDKSWRDLSWLRIETERHQGLVLHARLDDLPQRVEPGAVVHVWKISPKQPITVKAVNSQGAPLANCTVQVIYQAGFGNLETAEPIDDYDPGSTNPLTANHAQLLAAGVTDSEGRTTLMCSRTRGALVRCRLQGFRDACVPLNAEPGSAEGELVAVLQEAFEMRFRISDIDGRSPHIYLHAQSGGRNASARLERGVGTCKDLTAGAYSVFLMLDRQTERSYHWLGDVVVGRGSPDSFEASAIAATLSPVEIRCADLLAGDRLEFVQVPLGFAVASKTVSTPGRVVVSLAVGSYDIRRMRSEPGLENPESVVCADGPVVVEKGVASMAIAFPVMPGRVRLVREGVPAARQWVQVAGIMSALYRTDADGWVRFAAVPAKSFLLHAVHYTRSGWRPTGPTWAIRGEDLEGSVEAGEAK